MSKIAFTALLNRPDSVLSPHFGKAKWILIRDDAGQLAFEQNTGLNGRGVVEILRRAGCTDVVSAEIGEGAYHHLQETGIRCWLGPEGVPAPRLAEMLAHNELSQLNPKAHDGEGCCQHRGHTEAQTGHGSGGHGGCCCRHSKVEKG